MHKEVLYPLQEGYIGPTNEDLGEFKEYVGWSSNELAKIVDIKSKRMRGFLSERGYIKGARIEYAPWRLLLESFAVVEPVHKNVRKPLLKTELFENGEGWIAPTKKELKLIFRRSDARFDEMVALLKLNKAELKELMEPGGKWSKVLDKEVWFKFIKGIGIESLDDFTEMPKLPDKTLLPIDEDYQPPRPNVIRKLVAWSGYSMDEIAATVGLPGSAFGFYCSNKSFRGGDESVLDGLFSREHWRPPFSRELKMIITVTKCDPVRASKALGISQGFIKGCLESSGSRRVHVDKDKWLSFMDELGIFSGEQFKGLSEKASDNKPIPYASWRLLLHIFGLVEVKVFERNLK